MKVAIVHDGLATAGGGGGAERTLTALLEIYPDAPVYTTVYNPDRMPPHFRRYDIRPSFIQRLPLARSHFKLYFPLMPAAVERFDLSGYDVVISGHHSVAKGALTRPGTLHVCYCYSPARYLWDLSGQYARSGPLGRLAGTVGSPILTALRLWDVATAHRVDHFIAISRHVAARIWKYYRRPATVISPPVDTALFRPAASAREIGDLYLMVGRLTAYKRADLAVEAFNRLGWPLVLIGEGEERKRLRRAARPNISFLGRQPDEVVRDLYARCRALLFPGEEDFGIVPLEAQASGRPVIAYGAGGALETVVEGETGAFFAPQTPEALVEALQGFDPWAYDPQRIRAHALQFDKEVFKARLRAFVEEKYAEHRAGMRKSSYADGG